MTAQTPIYGLEYLVQGEPARNTRAALENNAFTIEAALQAGGVAAPGASDLLAVSGRVSVLETAAAAQPYAILKGASSGSTNVTTGTWTAIPMAQEDADPLGGHSTTTNTSRWTCPAGQGGLYLAGGSVAWANSGTAGRRISGVRKNGTEHTGSNDASPPTGANFMQKGAAPYPFILVPNDYLELYAYQDSGGTLAVTLSSVSLWLYRLLKI